MTNSNKGDVRRRFAAALMAGVAGIALPVAALSRAGAQESAVQLQTLTVEGKTESPYGPVEGYVAQRGATGTKTDTPLKETPQSVSVVTADQMKDQGATNVQQALRYTPGVMADSYGPDSRVDSFQIRGMSADTYLDGMRITNSWWNSQRLDPYMLERMEVLRGPSSVLYGSTTTAGLLNLVSKRPQEKELHEVGVQYGSFNRKQIQTDHTGKLTADGQWLYRIVGIGRDSDYQTDYVKDDRVVVMPAITWRPTNQTNWTMIATYQKDKTGSSNPFPPHSGTIFSNPNGQIPINRFAGDPATDLYQTETLSLASLFEHRFSDAFKVSHNMRYSDIDGAYHTAYVYPWSYLDPAQRTVSRYVDWWDARRKTFTSDSNAELKFSSGPLAHKLLVGFDFRRMNESGQTGGYVDATPFDLYAPTYNSIAAPTMTPTPGLTQRQAGFDAQDQMRWGDLIGVFGLRHDTATSDIQGLEAQTDRAWSGRAGLMYELPHGITPYVSYAQSFDPQFGSAPYGNDRCLDTSSGLCKPVYGEQYEVGFKYSQSKDLVVNGALFDITQKNRKTWDSTSNLGYTQIGKARIRGAELEVLATVARDVDLIGAYTYLDAKVEEGDNAGKHIETVPQHQASLWAKYRFALLGVDGFSVGGGVRYIGAVWDGTDTIQTPGYTLFDAMASWENKNWRFQINGTNLTDKTYFTACLARGDCFFGSGRTVLATLTYKFGALSSRSDTALSR